MHPLYRDSYEWGYQTFQKARERGDWRVDYKGEAVYRWGWKAGKLEGTDAKGWIDGWDAAREEAADG